MVGHALGKAVDGVESVARVGRRHDPFVVRLVERFVDQRMVQTSMNPVDEKVCE